jgi:hypothetical protein
MDANGLAGAVIQLGSDVAMKKVSPTLEALFAEYETSLKKKHQAVVPKKHRNGNVSVIGTLTHLR